ncbi:MAG: MoaD/ThiS family protein [Verrucomicrobia bacterium]|nr:MAG: MoaD/ThiS family protein [Verrucomicrobiota bacterium]
MLPRVRELHLTYYGMLADQRGLAEECLASSAATVAELFLELSAKFQFGVEMKHLRVAVDDVFVPWDYSLHDGARIAWLPPMSGG